MPLEGTVSLLLLGELLGTLVLGLAVGTVAGWILRAWMVRGPG